MRKILNWIRLVLNITKLDLLEFLRQKVVFLSSLFTPLSMVLSFGFAMNTTGSGMMTSNYFTEVVPGILAISIMFGATYSMGFTTIIDRQKRTTEDMFLSSNTFSAFIFARYFAMLIKILLQFIVVLLVIIIGFKYKIHYYPMLIVAFISTTLFFSCIGNLLALFATEVSFSSLTNFILMPLFYFGGVFFPLSNFGSVAKILKYVPMAIHVQIFKFATYGDTTYNTLPLALISIVYLAIILIFSIILFKKKVQSRH